MPFVGKTWRILLISVASSLLIIWLFIRPKNAGPYRGVPSQTSVLIDCNGMVAAGKQLLQVKKTELKSLANNHLMRQFWQELQAVEHLFHSRPEAVKAFAKNRILAAFTLQPSDSLHPVFLVQMPEDLEDMLKKVEKTIKSFPYRFHQQQLFTVHLNNEERWVMAQKDGILVFCRNSYLVEDALSELERGGGWWSGRARLDMLDDSAPIRFFLKPDPWKAHQSPQLTDQGKSIAELLVDNVRLLGISLQGEELKAACIPAGFLAEMGRWNEVEGREIFHLMPDHTAFFILAGFDDRTRFLSALSPGGLGGDFERFMLPWMGTQLAYLVTEPLSGTLQDDALLVLSVRDSSKARSLLEAYGEQRGSIAREKSGMFEVFGFQNNALLAPFLSGKNTRFSTPYAAHLGQFMVFAPNRHSLESFIEKYISNQTLGANTDFLQLEGKLRPSEQAVVAINGGYLQGLVAQLFSGKEPATAWSSDMEQLGKLGWMSVSLQPKPAQVTGLEFHYQVQTQALPVSNIFWKTNLDAPAITPVYTVAQPGLPYGTAILLQDQKTNLYCLDPSGTILWKKHLGSYLLSPVQAFDFYKNGRNCYLFNTKNQVWLLDDIGKEAPGYPLSLLANAVSALTPVDFDRNGRLHYFISCDNGNTYGFDPHGRVLEGWNPLSTGGKIAGPVIHFQQNGKDYLVLLKQDGEIAAYGRDGAPRFKPIRLDASFHNPAFLENGKKSMRVVCASTQGKVYSITPSGKIIEHTAQDKTWTGQPFEWAQWTKESTFGYALIQGKKLWMFELPSAGGNLPIQRVLTLPERQDKIFALGHNLGLCARSAQSIRVLDRKGETLAGYPLAGSTPFAFCVSGGENLLICGNGSAVFSYRVQN